MKEKIMEIKKKNFFLREQEEDDTNVKVDDTKNNASLQEMVSILLHSQTQVHIFHLQTKSYSEHKALQNYYKGIDGLVDGVIESYQGKYGVINGYKSIKTEEYKSNEQIIKYFKDLDNMVEKNRKSVKESYIQNQIDTIQELIHSTLYKLRFLK
jgi:hypothetical protein